MPDNEAPATRPGSRARRSSRGTDESANPSSRSGASPTKRVSWLGYAFWCLSFLAAMPLLISRITFEPAIGGSSVIGPIAAGLLGCILWFRNWDWRMRLPASSGATCLLLAGLVACIAGSLTVAWLNAIGFLLVAAAFCFAQSDAQHRPMGRLWILIAPAVLLLSHFVQDTWQAGEQFIQTLAHGVLNVARVPHLLLEEKLVSADGEVLPLGIQTPYGWLVFVSAAAIYSAVLKRSLLVALANAASAWMWWCVARVSFGVLLLKLPQLGIELSDITLAVLLGLLGGLLFLSTERILQVGLARVPDTVTDAKQANPWIAMWNAWSSDEAGTPNSLAHVQVRGSAMLALGLIALLTLCVQAGRLGGMFTLACASTLNFIA